jgi:hypothetical protein
MILRLAISISPLLLIALHPLTSRIFLGDIRPWIIPLSLGGILYLQAVRLARAPRVVSSSLSAGLKNAWRRFLEAPPKTAAFRLFLIALVVYTVLLSGFIVPAQPFTGDEPHYLLIARSIVRDGDVNLANDYGEQKYLEFYPGRLAAHAVAGNKGPDYLYSHHFPGISALIAPFYILGSRTGKSAVLVGMSRFPLAVLSALLAALLFLFVSDLVAKRAAALLVWALFALASPFVFYSYLIYSELPAALIALFILWAIVLKRNISAFMLILSGAGIGLMLWFGIKYLPLAGGVFLAAAASIMLDSKNKIRDVLGLSASAFVPLVLLIVFLKSLWGNVSPFVIYRGAPVSEYFKHGVIEIGNHFLGLLLDQRIGILVWGPYLLLFVPGLVLLFRKRRREFFLLLTPLAAWLVFSSLVYSWGAYCPPGRPLLPVLPLFAGLAGVALAGMDGTPKRVLGIGLVALTVLITLVCLRNPRLLYHENLAETAPPQGTYSLLLSSARTLYLDGTRLVPSLSNWKAAERREFPTIFWLIGIGVLTWIWLKTPRRASRPRRPLEAHAAGVLILSLLVLAFVFFRAGLDEERSFAIPGGRVFFQDENTHGLELAGFWTRGPSAATVIVQTPTPAERILIEVSGGVSGPVELAIGPRRGVVRLENRTDLRAVWSVDSPVGFPWRKGRLYAVRIRAVRPFVPHQLDPASADGRRLGVFARIQAESRR